MKNILVICLVCFSVSCSSVSSAPALARIAEPTEENYVLLKKAIAQGFRQRDVRLAKNAFVDSSELLFERDQFGGNSFDRPIKLHLMKANDNCYLLRVDTSEQWAVPGLKCVLK